LLDANDALLREKPNEGRTQVKAIDVRCGQKATFPQLSGMSALLPKPDVAHL
jgi:hypothetical protein